MLKSNSVFIDESFISDCRSRFNYFDWTIKKDDSEEYTITTKNTTIYTGRSTTNSSKCIKNGSFKVLNDILDPKTSTLSSD